MEQTFSKRAILWSLASGFALTVVGPAVPADAKPPAHAPAHGYRRKTESRYYQNPRFGNTVYYRTRRSLDIDYDGIPDYRDRWITRPQYVVRRKSIPRRKDIDADGIRNKRDRDRDGDGIRNVNDRDKDGDGRRNSRDDRPKNPRRR